MAYVPQSMTQEEWDALPPAPTPRVLTPEERAASDKESDAFIKTFVANLNANVLESEEWHRNNDPKAK